MSPRKLASLTLGVVSVGLLTVIWSFFSLVHYETISDKSAFWVAFAGWAFPMAVLIWALRNEPPRRMNQLFGNVIIAVGVAIVVLLILQSRWDALHSGVLAAMPGVLSGLLVGLDSFLLPRIIKGQIGPGH